MNLRQAAQQALEALEALKWKGSPSFVKDAITSLRAALAEPEQEPVAWQWLDTANYRKKLPADAIPEHWRPLYTAPTPRKPLTDSVVVPLEILEAAEASLGNFCGDLGWSAEDMQNMDNLSAYIAKHKAAHGITGEGA